MVKLHLQKFGGLREEQLEKVARMFAALAEPTRLRILQLLQEGPMNVGQIVERLGIKQANVSKQLAVLHQAALLERQRDGNQVHYSIGEPMIFELCGLVCAKIHRDATAEARAFQ